MNALLLLVASLILMVPVTASAQTFTTISPTSTTAGGASFALLVNGTGFDATAVVKWGGSTRATGIGGIPTQLTATILVADIATAGTVQVTVVQGATTLGPVAFTINNPVPAITSLNPSSIAAGGLGFPLTVTGTGFINGATVQWGGSGRVTNFGSSTSLTATITATDIASSGTVQVTVVQGGVTSNQSPFTISGAAAPPTISGLTPPSATVGGLGFNLRVNGSNFVNGSVVNFNGVARTTTFDTANQVTAAILAADISVLGTFPVTVSNGSVTSGAVNFSVTNPPPTITSLTPNTTTAGSATFSLSVVGTNFDGGSQVFWNGSPRTITIPNPPNQLVATILASDLLTAGLAQVTVSNSSGAISLPANFTVLAASGPTLLSISPVTVLPGSGPFTLTVNGANFVSGATVYWNGSARTTTPGSSTQITASILGPDVASAGLIPITVKNTPTGPASNAVIFMVGPPTITSISLPNGLSSGSAGDPGETLLVTGTNFVTGSQVQWNGSPRTTAYFSSTQLTATIPSTDVLSAGTAQITVLNPFGGVTPNTNISNAVTFTINNAVPVITSLNPSSVGVNNGAFPLIVTGTGFDPTATVFWNGTSRVTTFQGSTQLTAAILSGDTPASGTAQITVVGAGGTSAPVALPIGFGLTSLSPNTTPAGGLGFTLTVFGTGFVNGSTVLLNGAQGSHITAFVSATQLSVSIFAADIISAGTVSITVLQPGGVQVSNALIFTISASTFAISSITPGSANAGDPGTTLSVFGSGFIAGATVQWNGVALQTNYSSSAYLTASVPSANFAAAGAAVITVVNPGGIVSNSVIFVVNALGGGITPVISLSPTSLTFSGQSGGAAPASQPVTVNNLGGGTLTWTASVLSTSGGNWITVTNPIGSAGASFNVQITGTLFAPGTYTATVQVSAAGASNSPVNVSVSYIVTSSSNLTLSPSSLSFASATGGNPAAQSIGVSASSGAMSWTATASTTTGGNWIVLSKTSGTTSDTIGVTVNTAGLSAGTYNGTISITSPSAGNGAQTVSVTLTLGTPSIVLTPSSLAFSTSLGRNPSTQTFQVQNSKDGVLGWTAVASTQTGGNWLTIGPTSGTAPSTITVSANVAGMPAGAYAGSIVVSAIPGSNATNSPQTLPVILAIDAPTISPNGIVNGANFSKDAVVSPGSIASLFGTNLASGTASAGAPGEATTMTYSAKDGGAAATGLPTILGGTQVLVNGEAAGLFYVSPTQINFQMPPDVTGPTVQVVVVNNGVRGLPATASVQAAVPGIFTAIPGGTGQGAILNQDFSPNSASNPAPSGSVILIYATGLGATTNPPGTGQFAGTLPLSVTLATPFVSIGGIPAQVQFSGLAPGFVGLYQVNAVVPNGLASGSSVSLTLSIGGVPANTVTVAVQ